MAGRAGAVERQRVMAIIEICEICGHSAPCGCEAGNQTEWAGELVAHLREQELEITVPTLLDALGSRGLQLTLGDDAATAYWAGQLRALRRRRTG
jgi:hypothetical protein